MAEGELKPVITEVSDGRQTWRVPAGATPLRDSNPKNYELALRAAALSIRLYEHYAPTWIVALLPDSSVTDQYSRSEMVAFLAGVEAGRGE